MLRALWSKDKNAVGAQHHPVHIPGGSGGALIERAQADHKSGPSPQRRRRTVRVGRLYPEKRSDAEIHARAVISYIREECAHLAGSYVPQPDLAKFYGEVCKSEGWSPRHWCSIGRELGKLTDKRLLQRGGERFRAYRIPHGYHQRSKMA